MAWNVGIKTIKGRRYRYRQRTVRMGKHFKTENEYLGPVDAVYRSKGTGAARLQTVASAKFDAASAMMEKPLGAVAMAAVGHATGLGTVALAARVLEPESKTDRKKAICEAAAKAVNVSQ
ncbi:MAG: hypothetical protein ABL931_23750 [Usitatibacteraceae bacterium]